MAASPKTQKATGSDRRSGSGRKTTGSAQNAADSKQKTATASKQKAATGSKQETATGSAQKTQTASNRSASGSRRKAASSGQKTAGSQRRTTGAGQKTAGSRRKATASRQKTAGSQRKTTSPKPEKGIYIYGILPADVELATDMPGVGDPPGQLRLVHSDGLAALVSEVDLSKPLGSPQDLTAHEQIVDASAGAVPVLPARFGAVLASEEAIAEQLLAVNRDEFGDSLKQLEGRAQYVVKGRYVEQMILLEILAENRQAARLADKLRGADPYATRDARIKLGEIINDAVTVKRQKDTRALGNAMEGHCVASVVREPTHELDAAHVAFLVNTGQQSEMEQAIEDLARAWEGRIELRLLGPMAAYDFTGTVLSGE
jgi:hypothetical protein